MTRLGRIGALVVTILALAVPAAAQENPPQFQPLQVGAETGLPLPRFVSMKTSEANIRRGPSLTHRVD